jgi:glutamate synthase (ferredoxin)
MCQATLKYKKDTTSLYFLIEALVKNGPNTNAISLFLYPSFDEVRSKFGIIIESAEPREPHHFALLFGYGASAINPYLVNEIIRDQVDKGFITGMTPDYAIANYNKAIAKGILKIMNKIGISTFTFYRAAQILKFRFKQNFTLNIFHTPSRIEGIGLIEVEKKLKKDIRKHFQTESCQLIISRNWRYLQMEKNRRKTYV